MALADLWKSLRSMPEGHPDRKKTQDEINRIERWCIDNPDRCGGTIKKVTIWDAYYDTSKYRPPGYPEGSGAVFAEDLME